MSTTSFQTLAGFGEAETRVRGSRFIAVAGPAENEASARGVLDAASRTYFDATHHCAAWRFRDGTWRSLDAGEPSGSAGSPILAAIDGADLVDVVVVVTRYFGGTKLGVGGLARAYGDAAAASVRTAPRRRGVVALRLLIHYAYDDTSAVMRALERFAAVDVDHGYSATAGVTVTFSIPVQTVRDLEESLSKSSSGRVTVERLSETVVYDKSV